MFNVNGYIVELRNREFAWGECVLACVDEDSPPLSKFSFRRTGDYVALLRKLSLIVESL